jgi:hypothetical protein
MASFNKRKGLLPKIVIDNITIGKKESGKGNYTIKVVLAATDVKRMGGDHRGASFSWVNDKAVGKNLLSKYLKTKVVQCTDPLVARRLVNNSYQFAAMFGDVKNKHFKREKSTKQVERLTKAAGPDKKYSGQVTVRPAMNVEVKEMPLICDASMTPQPDGKKNPPKGKNPPPIAAPPGFGGEFGGGGVSNVSATSVEVTQVYEVEFEAEASVEFLSYHAVVFLDTEELFKDHGLNLASTVSPQMIHTTYGHVDSVYLLEGAGVVGARIVQETSVEEGHKHLYYYNNDSDTGIAALACHPDHPGVCHKHDIYQGRVMGARSDYDSRAGAKHHVHVLLEDREKIIIYDNIQTEKVKRKSIIRGRDKKEDSGILRSIKKPPLARSPKVTQSYVSPAYFGKNKCNQHSGIFVLNLKEVATKESDLEIDLPNLVENFTIYSVKIYRERAKEELEENSLGVKQMAIAEKSSGGLILKKKTDLADKVLVADINLPDATSGYVSELSAVYTEHPNVGLKYFHFTDQSIGKLVDGNYVYSVEIKLIDKTKEMLMAILEDLYVIREQVERHLLELELIEKGVARQGATRSSVWVNKVLGYYEMLGTSFGVGYGRTSLIESLTTQISHRTGKQEGIYSFIEIIANLTRQLQNLVLVPKATGASERNEIQTSNKDGGARDIVVYKTFDYIADASEPPGLGYEYLCFEESCDTPTKGLNLISMEQYLERVGLETKKYFGTADAIVQLDSTAYGKNEFNPTVNENQGPSNSTSYLSPCTAHVGDPDPVDLLKNRDPEILPNLEIKVLNQNLYKNFCRPKRVPPPKRAGKAGKEKTLPTNALVASQNVLGILSEMQSISVEPISAINNTMFMCQLNVQEGTTATYTDVQEYAANPDNQDLLQTRDFTGVTQEAITKKSKMQVAAADIFLPMLDSQIYEGFNLKNGGTTLSSKKTRMQANDARKWETTNKDNAISRLISDRRESNPIISDDIIQKEISSLPNQVMALFSAVKTDVDSVSVDRSSINFNFRMLMSVVYLAGFDDNGENIMIASPRWERLTLQRLRAARAQNKRLIARLVPWQDGRFGIIPVRGLELPIYHETFIISDSRVMMSEELPVPDPSLEPSEEPADELISERVRTGQRLSAGGRQGGGVGTGAMRSNRRMRSSKKKGGGSY